jgi:hypothetical protein
MTEEYNVEYEAEFTRTQLGTNIPKRLQELLDIIYSRTDLEEGYVKVIGLLIHNVARVCRDLLRTTDDQEALPATAWNARNLLELLVWAKYCAAHDNARRFYEDALRDFQGIADVYAKMCEVSGIENKFEASMRQNIEDVAINQLGLDSLDSKFTRVGEAAKVVGLGPLYDAHNKYLSKFAHPTAGLIIGVMRHDKDKIRPLQCLLATQGLYFAGECVSVLEQIVQANPPATSVRWGSIK